MNNTILNNTILLTKKIELSIVFNSIDLFINAIYFSIVIYFKNLRKIKYFQIHHVNLIGLIIVIISIIFNDSLYKSSSSIICSTFKSIILFFEFPQLVGNLDFDFSFPYFAG